MSASKVESRFLEFCRAHFHPGTSILIAVSGGSDSIALLRLFEKFQNPLQLKHLGVIHVNHGLRGDESDQDEQFVRECAQKFNIQFFVKHLSGKNADSSGIEEWARKERYSFFMSVMESGGFDCLATAHTLDDQAETVLMRLMRGSGVRGLRGILPVREDRVYRPLLKLRKAQLETWLQETGQEFRFDSSNNDTRFHRNMFRHKVIPMLKSIAPDISENLVALGEHMLNSWEKMTPDITDWVTKYVAKESRSSFSVDIGGIMKKDAFVSEALRSVFEEYRIAVSRSHIECIFESSDKKGEILLPGGWAYKIIKERIFFYNRNLFHTFRYKLTVPGVTEFHDLNKIFDITIETVPDESAIPRDNNTVMVDRGTTGESLVYRSAEDNDVFWPFGKKREMNLKEFLTKQGVAKPLRQNFGVVTDQYNKILWVPGIRINELCKVSKGTREVIKISMKTPTPNI
jgi:tRNA(Ile)-lysidine synthase